MKSPHKLVFRVGGAITKMFFHRSRSFRIDESIKFLDIILAFHRRSPSDFAKALTDFDTSILTVELVEHLLQYLPNENEVKRKEKNNIC